MYASVLLHAVTSHLTQLAVIDPGGNIASIVVGERWCTYT